jgi:UDP:flavonoid glycosyltransferase YjiC (YdhE family)
MRITIFAAGSRGDVQPCVMLGKALQQAGFNVLLAAPENFAGFVQGYELRFHSLRGDVQQIMASETGRKFMEDGGANPLKQVGAMRKMLGPVALQMAEDAFEACRDADALISLAIFATFAKTIAEVLHIPLINVEPTPMLPTRAFPAPGWPIQRNLGGLSNRLSGFLVLQIIWQWYRPFVNSFRQRFGLPPYTPASFYRILKTTPLLGAYSPKIIPHPSDWSETVALFGNGIYKAGFIPRQCLFDILHSMISGMTVQVIRPFCAALPAAKPFFRRFSQRCQQLFMNLPVPCQDLLRRPVAPAQVNKVIRLAFS